MKPDSLQREEAEEEELQMKPDSLQREEAEEEELQMKPTLQRMGQEGGPVSDDIEAEIQNARGSGQALAPDLQTQMGQAIGADFSGVRVHTDARSDALNRSVGARAFTTGQDVFFKQGEYQPGNKGGQELIAHELTHVKQQSGTEAISRKFTAYGWTDSKQEDSPLVIKSDEKEAESIIKAIADDPMSVKALNEIWENYDEAYKHKPQQRYKLRTKTKEIHDSKEERYKALKSYAENHNHETGVIYKDSYPHLYFLWVNCITSQFSLLAAEAESPETERQDNHYDTVILGVGAAAGYYIMGNLATMTPENTAVIGTVQPWDKNDPMARAIALNHENQAWTLKPDTNEEEDAGEKTGYWDDGRSAALTEEIQQVLGAVTWINGWVKSVEKTTDGTTITYIDNNNEKQQVHCGLIVSALGGGAESLKKEEKDARRKWKEKAHNDDWQPVFTLNEFQRWLRQKENEGQGLNGSRVVVVGANAGVDAAYTCTNAGGKLYWYVGSGMALAAAMKNTNINWDNVEAVYFGYGMYDGVTSEGEVWVKPDSPKADEAKKMRTEDSDKAKAFDRASGGKWKDCQGKFQPAKAALVDVYVSASGQDDAEIAQTAGLPSSKEKEFHNLRVVYSDGSISSVPLHEEKATIQRPRSPKSAQEAKRGESSYDNLSNPETVWNNLAPKLNHIAQAQDIKVDFSTMNLAKLTVTRTVGQDQDLLAPQEIIQPVAVYQLGEGEDAIGSINQAKKGTLIVGAQARPYLTKAGYKGAAVDQVEQVVDIGQITPTRQAIQQITNIAARGAMGKADYTYGTRDEIAATVAAKGVTGITADLITEAIMWSRSQPGLGQVLAGSGAKDMDERLTPAPRTKRMKEFWDAVLSTLGS
jgi:hypothetical protein